MRLAVLSMLTAPFAIVVLLLASAAPQNAESVANAQQAPSTQPAPPAVMPKSLYEVMVEMDKALSAIESNAYDPKLHTAALKAITRFQQASIEAKSMEPPMIPTWAEDKKSKIRTGYRLQMIELVEASLALESAFLTNAAPETKRKLIEKLRKIEKAGHRNYR